MPAPLRCPACSAPLDVPPEFATTVRCSYCGAAVLLTERGGHVQAALAQQRYSDAIADVLRQLRAGSKLGAIKVYREHFGVGLAEAKYAVERLEAGQPGMAPAPAAHSIPATSMSPAARPRQPRAAVTAAVFAVAVSASVGVVAMRTTVQETTVSALRPGDDKGSLAREVLRFGSEGNGAGRFQDARMLTVDGDGRVYVADYVGSRVQVFDSAGTFLTQWMVSTENPLQDLAADRQGNVYLVQSGRIRRVEGSTGRALDSIRSPNVFGWEDVTVALDGTLWAIAMGDVVHMDRGGRVLQTINVPERVGERAFPEKVVVNGEGHLYLTDQSNSNIYHLDPTGRFVDRFGTEQRMGVPMSAAEDMVLDGRGRLLVSYLGGGIVVYDADGRELGAIDGENEDELVFGIAINDRDEVYAALAKDHQVVKYRLNP
jgi:DNA-binding beta-propeller fold protein YncE/DNA-directed RNA polymerase subunit RPC12/RpoP